MNNDYKTLFDNYELPMIIISRTGKYLDYNKAYLNLLGFDKEEKLISYEPHNFSPILQLDGKKSYEKSKEMIQIAFEYGSNEFIWVHKKRNGETIFSHVFLTKITFREKEALQGVIKDISEEEKLKRLVTEKTKALNEQYALLRAVIDETPNPIVVKNYDGKFVLVNKFVAKLYNAKIDEMIGKDDGDYIHDKEQADFFRKNVKEIMNEGKTRIVYEDSYDVKTNEKRNFMSIKKPFRNEKGEKFILVLANDITEMKKANIALKEKEHMLFQQSKMAAMGEMIGNIAHQWRQPLSNISAITSSMKVKKELNLTNKHEEEKDLSMILNTVEHLSQTIEDFRNFFSTNKLEETFTFDEIFKKIEALISAQYKCNNIRFVKNFTKVKINTIKNELIQVIMNILNNSRDAFFNNKDVIKKLIFIDVYEKDNSILIEIKDNAGGINKSIINRIFEPYFTTKHKSQGTGIGLYMSNEMVIKHMKGELLVSNDSFTFENEKYKGAKFTICLPNIFN